MGRQMRRPRKRVASHKWETIFEHLEKAADKLVKQPEQAVVEAAAAREWAERWCQNSREDTSMGLTVVRAIEEEVLGPLRHGTKVTPLEIDACMRGMRRFIELQAKVCAVKNAQHQLVSQYGAHKTPQPVSNRAIAEAIRRVVNALGTQRRGAAEG